GKEFVLRPALCLVAGGRQDEQHTKTDVGGGVITERRAAGHGPVATRAATNHARAASAAGRVLHGTFPVIVRLIAVLTPLPHIAVHVVQAPFVRQLLADRMRLDAWIPPVPGVAFELGLVVTEAVPSA